MSKRDENPYWTAVAAAVTAEGEGTMVTEDEWSGEVAKSARFRLISPIIALGAFALIFIPCMMAGQALASGIYADLVAVGILLGIMFPLAFVLVAMGERNQRRTDEKVRNLNAELSDAVADAERLNMELSEAMSDADHQAQIRDAQVQRQRFESRLANALDMAEGEPEVIEVIERSFSTVLPQAPAELLLADNSHAHLHRMAAVGPDGKPPSCGVDSPDRCPAARRAQIQEFTDSDHLDACPKLRNRPEGQLSALCVPVSIMGRTVGVIHATGAPGAKVADDRIDDLATLAKLAGARIGLLRVMAETQLQASTDTLTGLLNRRSFSERVAAIPAHLYPMAMAMADFDHFKSLNDTYGHETGDRALRLFSRVLRDTLRREGLQPVCERAREAEQDRRRERAEWIPLPEDHRCKSDEATTVGHVEVERPGQSVSQVHPAESGQHARDDDRRVSRGDDLQPDGRRGQRLLADGPQPQARARAEQEPPDDRDQQQTDPGQQVGVVADRVTDERDVLDPREVTFGTSGSVPGEPLSP